MAADARPRLVAIHVAVNDAANGMFAGRLDALEVHQGRRHLFSLDTGIPGPRCVLRWVPGGGGYLRLGPSRYRWIGRRSWVGNWCWEVLTFRVAEAVRLLNDIRASGLWGWDDGCTSWSQRWDSGRPFMIADFQGAARQGGRR
jgi:hypothetical protein